jgi:hypothetical protein
MPLQLLLTTTGSKTPVYADGRRITHPTSNLNVLEQTTIRKLLQDPSFIADHAAGHFTLGLQDGRPITSGILSDILEPQVFGCLHNFTALVAPSTSDDNTKGYVIGSRWVDTLAGVSYECVKATNPATWRSVTEVNPGTGFVSQVGLVASEPEQQTSNTGVPGVIAYNRDYTPPEAGTFTIWWYMELTCNNNKGVEVTVEVDGVEIGEHTHFPGLGGSYTGFSGLDDATWDTTQHSIIVRFRSLQSSNNARIRRIRTQILKVA